MASPLTPSSTIYIYPTPIFISAPIPEKIPNTTTPATVEPPKDATPSSIPAPTTPSPPPSTGPSSYLSTPQLLTAPQTLIPPAALAVKATSTKTIGAASKPAIQQEGPVQVEPPPPAKDKKVGQSKPATVSEDGKRPKTKNGYLPPGTSLAAASSKDKEKTKTKTKKRKGDEDDDEDDDDEDEGKKWMRYEAVESSITTTVEALEGGGRRTVWVRTDREVTVLIEPAIEEKKEKDKGKGKDEKKEKEAAVVGGISARKERMRARMAG